MRVKVVKLLLQKIRSNPSETHFQITKMTMQTRIQSQTLLQQKNQLKFLQSNQILVQQIYQILSCQNLFNIFYIFKNNTIYKIYQTQAYIIIYPLKLMIGPSSSIGKNHSKRDSQSFGSKRNIQSTFQILFKKLSSTITQEKFMNLQEEAKQMNDNLNSSFENIEKILNKRDEAVTNQHDHFRLKVEKILNDCAESMGNILQSNVESGEQNIENWKLLTTKKENYEKMHENLVSIKKKNVDFTFKKKNTK